MSEADVEMDSIDVADPRIQNKLELVREEIRKEIRKEFRVKEGIENLLKVRRYLSFHSDCSTNAVRGECAHIFTLISFLRNCAFKFSYTLLEMSQLLPVIDNTLSVYPYKEHDVEVCRTCFKILLLLYATNITQPTRIQ